MKNFKLLRILCVIIFASLLLATPARPAQADAAITLSPTEGKIGDQITITGEGFNKSTSKIDKYAAIYFSSDEATTEDDIDSEVTRYSLVKEAVWLDELGEFEVTFTVPDELNDGSRDEDVTSGTHYVYVCHYAGTTLMRRIRAVATFMVIRGEIFLDPEKGTVGTLVEITGEDFVDNEEIVIGYNGDEINIRDGDIETDHHGEFFSVVRIPESTAGTHNVTATIGSSQAQAEFTVEPGVLLDRQSGESNTEITVSGTGFDKMKPVNILFSDTAVATATTDVLGSFHTNFDVPELQAGIYKVSAEDGVNAGQAVFTVTAPPPPPTPPPPEPPASISISETAGNIGQAVIINGTGFEANAMVTIRYDNELLTAANTDSQGAFTASFTVPIAKYGDHSITASDGKNTSDINFTIESTPPPVPTLLLPEMEAKVEPPFYFSWQDVADPSSPVTYTIQVATSPDFSANTILLEKTGLAETEYSLTAEESLRVTGKTPYYWRVRAVDAASNEGQWTSPRIVYVATAGIPSWLIYTIGIVIVLLLLALGFFIYMKKRAPKKKYRDK